MQVVIADDVDDLFRPAEGLDLGHHGFRGSGKASIGDSPVVHFTRLPDPTLLAVVQLAGRGQSGEATLRPWDENQWWRLEEMGNLSDPVDDWLDEEGLDRKSTRLKSSHLG